LEYVRYFQ